MGNRVTCMFLFALGDQVVWPADPTQPYQIHLRRWVESSVSSWGEYALVEARASGRGHVCWVNEADLAPSPPLP
jgi:hypothetical protein